MNTKTNNSINSIFILEVFKTLIKSIFYEINDFLTRSISFQSELEFKLRKNGFFTIDNFLSDEECASLIKIIDKNVNKDFCWRDKYDSDIRIFGIENIAPPFKKMFYKHDLYNIYKKYISRNTLYETKMAAKMTFSKKNLGSGGGWHRDTVNVRQMKFILYLSDVTEDNGCFQYIPGSHKNNNKFESAKILRSSIIPQRYSVEDVDLIVKKLNLKVNSITGKKGTLLVVDTSGLHRGKPMNSGIRYAVTNYMYDQPIGKSVSDLIVNPK